MSGGGHSPSALPTGIQGANSTALPKSQKDFRRVVTVPLKIELSS